MDAIKTLSRCALLRDFTETGLQILASIAEARTVPGGTSIFAEGTVGDAMHVIATGRVLLSVRGPSGEEAQLGWLAPGDHFGELSLLMAGSRRLVTATADGDVQLVTIRQRDFARLQAQKPQACLKLALAISGSLGQRLGENREILGSLLASAARR